MIGHDIEANSPERLGVAIPLDYDGTSFDPHDELLSDDEAISICASAYTADSFQPYQLTTYMSGNNCDNLLKRLEA